MKVFVVLIDGYIGDDFNETDSNCFSESIDSIWLDGIKAIERAIRYNGRVIEHDVEE